MSVPFTLRFAFQEYDLEKLNPDDPAYAFTIIERTLAYGNREELRWLFKVYGRERVLTWLKEDGWRTLPHQGLLFWTAYFELPPFPERGGVWPH